MPQSDNLLTEDEKVRIRHHLGYLNVNETETFVLGTPASVETQFIIEGAFNYVRAQALPKIRQLLADLDMIECRMISTLENAEVTRVGDIEMNNQGRDGNQNTLSRMYERQKGKLCNLLGVSTNPFDKSTGYFAGGRSLNARVVG